MVLLFTFLARLFGKFRQEFCLLERPCHAYDPIFVRGRLMSTTRAKGEGIKSAFAAEKKGKRRQVAKIERRFMYYRDLMLHEGNMRTTYHKFHKLHSMCAYRGFLIKKQRGSILSRNRFIDFFVFLSFEVVGRHSYTRMDQTFSKVG